MKNLITLILVSGSYFVSFQSMSGLAPAAPPPDSLSLDQSGRANYIIAKHVIGTGGINGATSANHFHRATAGQTFTGEMQGANHFLLAGFWLPGIGTTAVRPEEPMVLPTRFILHQNYPNPFNPQTTIQFDLPKPCRITVEVFNVVGQRIRLLISDVRGPGVIQVVWDGRDESGELMGSGIYLYRLIAHESGASPKVLVLFQALKKMAFIK